MISFRLHKRLDGSAGVFDLDLEQEVARGEIVALYGPSGAGKTSILRMLAGLMQPDDGYIRIDSVSWYDASEKVFTPARKRSVGFVFQDYALFPNMSVIEQLRFAEPSGEAKDTIDLLLEKTGLHGLQDRLPKALSGGQKQRVALARALVRKPDILLLDEPLAALDHGSRISMQQLLADLHEEFRPTILLVTHDLGEIWRLANRVLQIEDGSIVRSGSPSEVFFSHKEGTDLSVIGEILEVQEQSEHLRVTVRIGNQVNSFNLPSDSGPFPAPGDRVHLAFHNSTPMIRKVTED